MGDATLARKNVKWGDPHESLRIAPIYNHLQTLVFYNPQIAAGVNSKLTAAGSRLYKEA